MQTSLCSTTARAPGARRVLMDERGRVQRLHPRASAGDSAESPCGLRLMGKKVSAKRVGRLCSRFVLRKLLLSASPSCSLVWLSWAVPWAVPWVSRACRTGSPSSVGLAMRLSLSRISVACCFVLSLNKQMLDHKFWGHASLLKRSRTKRGWRSRRCRRQPPQVGVGQRLRHPSCSVEARRVLCAHDRGGSNDRRMDGATAFSLWQHSPPHCLGFGAWRQDLGRHRDTLCGWAHGHMDA